MRSFHFLLAITGVLVCSCKNDNSYIQLSNNITQVELDDISSDIQLISVKSSQPMKGISRCYCFGDYDFLLSDDYRTIYCLEGDSITSVFDKYGRGRGEYQGINTLAYSVEDSLVYVFDSSLRLLIYKGFDYKLTGIIENLPEFQSMRVVDKDHLLAVCLIRDDNLDAGYGFRLIDTKIGESSEWLLTMGYLGMVFHNVSDYYQCGDSTYFSVGDNVVNRIYLYFDGELTTQLEFTYSKDLRFPERVLIDDTDNLTDNINAYLTFNDYVKSGNRYCVGANYPIISSDGSRFMFWSFPEGGDNIMTIISNNQIDRYHIAIPGIAGFVAPNCTSKNYYVVLCEEIKRDEQTDIGSNTLLANRIFEQIENNEGNPVILKFKVK